MRKCTSCGLPFSGRKEECIREKCIRTRKVVKCLEGYKFRPRKPWNQIQNQLQQRSPKIKS